MMMIFMMLSFVAVTVLLFIVLINITIVLKCEASYGRMPAEQGACPKVLLLFIVYFFKFIKLVQKFVAPPPKIQ